MTAPITFLDGYQRKLFDILEEFFLRATGKYANEFATIATFSQEIRRNAAQIGPRGERSFAWFESEILALYSQEGAEVFTASQSLGGMKLVLGGGSRFQESQLSSVLGSSLFSDTVLIPDPVMPWVEKARTEEAFARVLLLQSVHALLQLKPIVDARLGYPPIAVFPSWEKTLEDKDPVTLAGQSQLVADVMSQCTGDCLETIDDVLSFVTSFPERFLEAVDANHLLVGPDGPLDEPVLLALARYSEHLRTWRSKEWMAMYDAAPIPLQVLNCVMERLGPMFHAMENADSIRAHPLLALEQHAHYFKIASGANSARLENLRLLDPRTRILVDAVSTKRLEWLGRISVEDLVALRMDNQNVEFRKKLQGVISRLHDSTLKDIDTVAAEVSHEISTTFVDHARAQRRLQEKYNRTHGQTLLSAVAAVGVAMIPSLAPFLGAVAPFALAAKYGNDKLAELAERKTLSRSLFGVLASINGGQ